MNRRLLFLIPLLALAACGTEEPPETVQGTPLETTDVPDAVVGSYVLYAVDDEPLPGGVGQRDGCDVQLSEGRLKLGSNALYTLDVLARTACEDENDEANRINRTTSEGPFVVEGFEVRFGTEVTRVDEETGEIEPEEEEANMADLFRANAFAGTGVLRDTLLTVQLTDDLTTLTFVKD